MADMMDDEMESCQLLDYHLFTFKAVISCRADVDAIQS